MCGISGIITAQGSSNDVLSHIFEINQRLFHRGPDDHGFLFFNEHQTNCVAGNYTSEKSINGELPYSPKKYSSTCIKSAKGTLSHNRLSIIDVTESGFQPMCDAKKSCWIVYNGEIYNFKELKSKLIKKGYYFNSESDTEVLLNSYLEWGEKCVDYFNGMWAFCIYDTTSQKLFLSRDRFGVKPLYYRLSNEIFAFSSEQKGLYDFPNEDDTLNKQAVFDYLSMGLIENENINFVDEVQELLPGNSAFFDLKTNQIDTWKYYELTYAKKWEKQSANKLNTYTSTITELVDKAIGRRLVSDVPVGTCLSGGLDSSIIACSIGEKLKTQKVEAIQGRQKTFTSCFKGEQVDEEEWAKKVVLVTNSEWFKEYPSMQRFMKEFEIMVYHQDIPFFGSSTFSHYCVMDRVHQEGIKVTLDGQGADELFGGYGQHYASYMENALQSFDLKAFINNLKDMSSNFSNWSNLFRIPIKYNIGKRLGQKRLAKQFREKNIEFQYIKNDFWKKNSQRISKLNKKYTPNLNDQLHNEFCGTAFKDLLRTADRNAMRFSVESRMPFADDIDLIEYVFSISGSYKIQNSYSKFLLRESAKKSVPKEIINRRDKIGFATPEQKWFKKYSKELKEFIPEISDEYVDWKRLYQDWDAVIEYSCKNGTTRLWRLINFAVWRKVFKI